MGRRMGHKVVVGRGAIVVIIIMESVVVDIRTAAAARCMARSTMGTESRSETRRNQYGLLCDDDDDGGEDTVDACCFCTSYISKTMIL